VCEAQVQWVLQCSLDGPEAGLAGGLRALSGSMVQNSPVSLYVLRELTPTRRQPFCQGSQGIGVKPRGGKSVIEFMYLLGSVEF
jgi:hypothetical protein